VFSPKFSYVNRCLTFTGDKVYACETWSLREEHRLRGFENRALRIFGPKKEEVAGGWRILHKEELYNLYDSPNIINVVKSRSMRWAGHVVRMGGMFNV
jgi:hypothetical protein